MFTLSDYVMNQLLSRDELQSVEECCKNQISFQLKRVNVQTTLTAILDSAVLPEYAFLEPALQTKTAEGDLGVSRTNAFKV